MTIKDIARESGYAISTVSRVLNNHADVSAEARERILAVVQAHDFRLNNNAKHLKQRQSANIAIVVKGNRNLLFASIVEAIQVQAQNAGYATVVHYLDEGENEVQYARHLCRESKPVGLAFLGGLPEHFEKHFGAISLPSVLVTMRGDKFSFPNLSSVSVDDFDAAQNAVSYLLNQGHREIGVISGDVAISGPARLRRDGYQAAFAAFDLPFDVATQAETSRYSYQGGYAAMSRLLERKPDVTAVFCMSDMMAIGAIRALADHGKRVPEDISVVGYDGLDICRFSNPRLATVRQDTALLAKKSVEILVASITENHPAQHVLLPYHWVAGESIKPQPDR